MGLDMYLSAKRYLTNYDFHPEEKAVNQRVKEALGLQGYDRESQSMEVKLTVAYWRKANQIHNWFVQNVQGGKDNCDEYFVPRDALIDLLETVNVVLANRDSSKLKPVEGFFFGSTNIDEWYWDDLEHTKTMVTHALEDTALKDAMFYYESSW
jgi:hypothetical protein